ncbi:MAG: hypothetical protein LBD90_09100 [Bifidobacteriaceae bacterium]|nr:hypothetical protein [Bifidobacteriaceae bacterium]
MITLLAAASAAFWLFAPGLVVGRAVGMRGLSLAALAPALSLAALGAGSALAPLAGLDWGYLTALASTGLGALIAFGVGRVAPIRAPRVLPRWPRRTWLALLGAGSLAAGLVFGLTLAGMGGAGGIAQSGDLVFHGNLVRFILETGDASPWQAGTLNAPGAAAAYYPSATHAIAALAPAPAQVWPALNMVWLVAGSAVWLLGLVYLARVLFPSRPRFAIAAAALGLLYQGQPSSLVFLLANAVGVALLPALLGWSVQLARVVHLATAGRVARSLVLLVALAGGAFAHPAAVFSYAAVASPIALYILVTAARRAWSRGYRVATVVALALLAGLLAAAVVALYAVPEVRSVVAFGGWIGSSNVFVATALALVDATTLFQVGPNLLVLAGLAAGAGWALARRRRRWLILSFGLVLVLYVGAVAKIKLLEPLTGLFYSDRTRLGPLLAVAGIPLILWGLDWVQGVWRAAPRRRRARRWIASVTAIGLVSALALTAARPFRMHAVYFDLRPGAIPAERRFFDADELAMIQRLPEELPPGAVVLGDPTNGSAFLYSVSGIPVVFPHVTGSWDAPRRYLSEHFGELGRDSGVCAALAELGVEYVYLDPVTYWDSDRFAEMTTGLEAEGNLELIDSGGSAGLYRITACD